MKEGNTPSLEQLVEACKMALECLSPAIQEMDPAEATAKRQATRVALRRAIADNG